MEILFGFSLLAAFGYGLIMRWYGRQWKRIPAWSAPPDFQPATSVSVLIPARNESGAIEACLQSVFQNDYPSILLEVLVIDDFSEDKTAEKVSAFSHSSLHLVRMSDHFSSEQISAHKKKAIETGISQSNGQLIITTDADCEVQPGWLKEMVSYYELHKPAMIAGPVNFFREKNTFERFQSLDLIGMMGITGAGIGSGRMYMANGANLAYERSAFESVGGFEGIDRLASGDDMLLMEKIARAFPGRVAFLKSRRATVFTRAMPSLKTFFYQRIRWASKSTHYRDWKVTAILAWVLGFCSLIWLWMLLIPFSGLEALTGFLCLLALKSLADFFFLRQMSTYFGRAELMHSFWAAEFLHTLYISVIGLWSNFQKTYTWKGRSVR